MNDDSDHGYGPAARFVMLACSGLLAWTAAGCTAGECAHETGETAPAPIAAVAVAMAPQPVEQADPTPAMEETVEAAPTGNPAGADRVEEPQARGGSVEDAGGNGAAHKRRCARGEVATPCDIAAPACQRALFDLAKCLRGSSDAALPPIEVLSDEAFTARLSAPDEPVMEMHQEETRQRAQLDRALTMLGLLRDEPDKAQADDGVARTAAIYDSRENYVLVRRYGATTSLQSNATLVHELVHALQDAELDLLAVLSERHNYDESMTRIALVEGEAVVYELLGVEELADRDLDWDKVLQSQRETLDMAYRSSRNPIVAARMTYPYSYGTHYVADTWFAGGRDAVRALLDQDLVSSDLMRHAVGTQPLAHGPKLGAPRSTDAFETLTSDESLGAFIQFGLFPGDDARAFQAALTLRDDRLDVYVAPGGEPIAVWQQRWAGPAGQQALRLYTETLKPGTFQVQDDGDDITTLIAAETGEGLQRWLATDGS